MPHSPFREAQEWYCISHLLYIRELDTMLLFDKIQLRKSPSGQNCYTRILVIKNV